MTLRPENFTEQAQEVLASSQELVRHYRHSQWDVEHILLALLQLEKGVPMEIMEALAVNVEAMKVRVEQALGRTPKLTQDTTQI